MFAFYMFTRQNREKLQVFKNNENKLLLDSFTCGAYLRYKIEKQK